MSFVRIIIIPFCGNLIFYNVDLLYIFSYPCPGINVPRTRFLPVKTTSDLLIIMSNLYSLKAGFLEMNPKRSFQAVPLVKLGTSFTKVRPRRYL